MGAWASLFAEDQLGTIHLGMREALVRSCRAHPMSSGVTAAECDRRTEILMKWTGELRADYQWSIQRIIDSYDAILAAELAGGKWSPVGVDSSMWVPSG